MKTRGTAYKIHVVTLGCAKNLVDSEYMLGALLKHGFEVVSSPKDADIIIINTCSFIDPAKEESIDTILQIAHDKGNKKICVCGCIVSLFKEKLFEQMPEIDAIIDPFNTDKIVDVCEQLKGGKSRIKFVEKKRSKYQFKNRERLLTGLRHSVYLKIADGCDNRCSYCTIPQIRGGYRSLPRNMVIQQATGLVDAGYREIILVAQDTTDYGKDLYGENYKLADLLSDLDRIPGDYHIRLMYTNPAKIDQELIDALKLEHVLKYIDMPIQHVSDAVLSAMNRKVKFAQIDDTIKKLKEQIPEIALRTTIMVGYPGETEADFQKLVQLVESNQFLHLGVFAYSPQDDTKAATLEGYDPDIAWERKEMLEFLQTENYCENNRKLIGNIVKVIIDRDTLRDGFYLGRTLQDAPEIDRQVKLHGDAEPGDIVDVLILRAFEYKMLGTVL